MFGYIYKTTNLINGKIYVGKHAVPEFDTSYMGSGKTLIKAFKKYGKENFDCILLEAVDTEDELNSREKFWIAELNARDKKVGYNINEGGEGNPGYKHTDACKAAISGKKKGDKWYYSGNTYIVIKDGDEIPEGFIPGKPSRTEDTKSKISNTIKSRNLKAYMNTELQKTIYLGPDDDIPDGFIPGRYVAPDIYAEWKEKLRQASTGQTHICSEEQKERLREAHTGTKCYTNGVSSIRLKPGDPVPDGFYLGRTDTEAVRAGRKAAAEKMKGHPVSDYTRMRSSQAHLGVTPTNAKKVFCIDTDKLYTSIHSASKDTTVPTNYINKALKNQDRATVKYKGKQYTFELQHE